MLQLDLLKRWQRIVTFLNQIYPRVNPTLDYINAFTCLIATILSANTTDRGVNKITPLLFKKADNPVDFIREFGIETLTKILRPIGLALKKAINVLKTCSMLIVNYGGIVPDSLIELVKLPGVGPKTARIVLSQIYKQNYFAVDTHCSRLIKRWGLGIGNPEKLSLSTEKILGKVYNLSELHLKMVNYGRNYCPAKKHSPSICIICNEINKDS